VGCTTFKRSTPIGGATEFAEAYKFGYARTVRALLSCGLRPTEAEEHAQAGWVRAFEKLHSLRDPEQVLPFAIQISLNMMRDDFRRTSRLVSLETAYNSAVASGLTATGIDTDRAVDRTLCCCSERARQMLQAVYLEQRSTAEVATDLGITRGAMLARLSRARKAARRGLVRVDRERTFS
jgi:RNA polymerase sigma factor (sigma-70 family)